MRQARAGPPASEKAGAAEPSEELTCATQKGQRVNEAGQMMTRTTQWHQVELRAVCPSPHPLTLLPTSGKLDPE